MEYILSRRIPRLTPSPPSSNEGGAGGGHHDDDARNDIINHHATTQTTNKTTTFADRTANTHPNNSRNHLYLHWNPLGPVRTYNNISSTRRGTSTTITSCPPQRERDRTREATATHLRRRHQARRGSWVVPTSPLNLEPPRRASESPRGPQSSRKRRRIASSTSSILGRRGCQAGVKHPQRQSRHARSYGTFAMPANEGACFGEFEAPAPSRLVISLAYPQTSPRPRSSPLSSSATLPWRDYRRRRRRVSMHNRRSTLRGRKCANQ